MEAELIEYFAAEDEEPIDIDSMSEDEINELIDRKRTNKPKDGNTQGELTPRQRAILEYCSDKNQWFSPSDLQAKLKACRGISTKALIDDFETLTQAGYGQVRETDKTTLWHPKREI